MGVTNHLLTGMILQVSVLFGLLMCFFPKVEASDASDQIGLLKYNGRDGEI